MAPATISKSEWSKLGVETEKDKISIWIKGLIVTLTIWLFTIAMEIHHF